MLKGGDACDDRYWGNSFLPCEATFFSERDPQRRNYPVHDTWYIQERCTLFLSETPDLIIVYEL